jgi:hypothetical protein
VLAELHGKSGKLCTRAQSGELHCPLFVRSTSEDVVTAQVVQSLKTINPRWWLSHLLNQGLGRRRFTTQVYRSLRIDPWVNVPAFPRELLGYDEGSTQVDLVIRWENPPTTVYIEAKYASGLSTRTANSDAAGKLPGDQLIRNVRVGLHQCGYFRADALFEPSPRDFVLLLFTPVKGNVLVERYRDGHLLKKSIASPCRLTGLPAAPFIGEIDYADMRCVLRTGRRFMARSERHAADQLSEYLSFKLHTRPERLVQRPAELPLMD